MTDWQQLPGAPAIGTALCDLADIPDSGALEVTFGAGNDTFRVLLLRRGEAVWAYRNRCPHHSLPLNYEPGVFHTFDGDVVMCAHHIAMFRIEDGFCFDGPCQGATLDALPIRRDGTRLTLG